MSVRKYNDNTKCIVCGKTGVRAKNMCHSCYTKAQAGTIRRRKDIPIDKNRDRKRVFKSVCTTLKKHHNDLIDDPERLTTNFLEKLINVRCDIKDK